MLPYHLEIAGGGIRVGTSPGEVTTMSELPYLAIAAWSAWGLALLFCLPIPAARKLVLELTCLALRLAVLAALAGGALLFFRPDLTPPEVVRFTDTLPAVVRDWMPAPGSPAFGLCAAVVVAL